MRVITVIILVTFNERGVLVTRHSCPVMCQVFYCDHMTVVQFIIIKNSETTRHQLFWEIGGAVRRIQIWKSTLTIFSSHLSKNQLITQTHCVQIFLYFFGL